MRKLKVGLDADDILVDFVKGLIDFCNKEHGYSLKREDVTTYALSEVLKLPKEGARKLVDVFYFHPSFMGMPAVEGAVEGVQALREDGHELFVVTSRPDSLVRELTFQQINLHFPGAFKDIFFSYNDHVERGGRRKREICDDLGIGAFLDDNSIYAMQCASPERLTCLYSNANTVWNHSQTGDAKKEGIVVVPSWKDYVGQVRKYAENGKK